MALESGRGELLPEQKVDVATEKRRRSDPSRAPSTSTATMTMSSFSTRRDGSISPKAKTNAATLGDDADCSRKYRHRRLSPKQRVFVIKVGLFSLALSILVVVSASMTRTTLLKAQSYGRKLLENDAHPTVAGKPPPSLYHQINLNYPGIRSLTPNTTHASPHIYAIDDFLTEDECNFLIENVQNCLRPSTVGTGQENGRVLSASRTSWTCRIHRDDLPGLMGNVARLVNKPLEHVEHPQFARYEPTQRFAPHFDAYDTSNENLRQALLDGGNRLVTVLVYLNDVPRGGGTLFTDLGLEVRPRRGTAVVFFPARADGRMDRRAMHAALPAVDRKYVSQIWVRQGRYEGTVLREALGGEPEKRLALPEPSVERRAAKGDFY